MTKPDEYGTAVDHANTVRLARATFISTTMAEQLDRESVANITRLVDHLIAMGYLSTKFYMDYSAPVGPWLTVEEVTP